MKKQHKLLIENYIKAKDTNKPHLMKKTFKMSATLEVFSSTEGIKFPSKTKGLTNITKLLVQDFNKKYENIYTICFEEKSYEDDNSYGLRWLVVMNEKESGDLKVGFGTYIWTFQEDLVSSLDLRVDKMQTIIEEHKDEVIDAISSLSYPWAKQKDLEKATSHIASFDFVDQVS